MRNYLGDVLDSFRMSKGTFNIFSYNLIAYLYVLMNKFTQEYLALRVHLHPRFYCLMPPPYMAGM